MLLDRAEPREACLHEFRGLFHPLEPADPYDILIIRRGQPPPPRWTDVYLHPDSAGYRG